MMRTLCSLSVLSAGGGWTVDTHALTLDECACCRAATVCAAEEAIWREAAHLRNPGVRSWRNASAEQRARCQPRSQGGYEADQSASHASRGDSSACRCACHAEA